MRYWAVGLSIGLTIGGCTVYEGQRKNEEGPPSTVTTITDATTRGPSVTGNGKPMTDKRSLEAFTRVEVLGALEVTIDQNDNISVEIIGDSNLVPLVKTEVKDGVLRVQPERGLSARKPIQVHITAPALEAIALMGATKGVASGIVGPKLSLAITGASELEIDGEVDELTAEATGASHIRASDLEAKRAIVEVTGASGATVDVSETLEAIASGASDIEYTGEPKVTRRVSGASSVRAN